MIEKKAAAPKSKPKPKAKPNAPKRKRAPAKPKPAPPVEYRYSLVYRGTSPVQIAKLTARGHEPCPDGEGPALTTIEAKRGAKYWRREVSK